MKQRSGKKREEERKIERKREKEKGIEKKAEEDRGRQRRERETRKEEAKRIVKEIRERDRKRDERKGRREWRMLTAKFPGGIGNEATMVKAEGGRIASTRLYDPRSGNGEPNPIRVERK